jgi:hypothetical protein
MGIQLVIDNRRDGLPSAPGYYAAFPIEPSPLGDIVFPRGSTRLMGGRASVDAALDGMLAAGAGGVVVLVCHAFTQGLLLPFAPNGSALALTSTMAKMDAVIAAEAEAQAIRQMPKSSDKEVKAAIDRWTALIDRMQQPGLSLGPVTLKERETLYEKLIALRATEFGFPTSAELRSFFDKLRRVRALALDRLELRACNIGGDEATMKNVRTFFGAKNLTAPAVGTFYHEPFAIRTMLDEVRVLAEAEARRDNRRPAWPLGLQSDASRSIALVEHPRGKARGFVGAIQTGAKLVPRDFVLMVEETSAFHYRAEGAVVADSRGGPNWSKVREFVLGWIHPNSAYMQGPFPIAGLWTPGTELSEVGDMPYVLPNETGYMRLITKV